MTTKIRSATIKDSESLSILIHNAYKDVAERFGLTRENCPTHPSFCTAHWVEDDILKDVSYFVLEQDGVLSGCVALRKVLPGVCGLERLAVRPEYRRRGFGDQLIRNALAEAQRCGATRVELALIADHEELRGWYERRGFSAIEKKIIPHLPFEVLTMGIELHEHGPISGM